MKIYTRKGDLGDTSLLNSGSERVKKSHLNIEGYGTVDELNSWIGLLLSEWIQPSAIHIPHTLAQIQNDLFVVGSLLAVDPEKPLGFPLPQLPSTHVKHLEHEIDTMEEQLTPLSHFILPGGHKEVSHIHICRTICRRAERNVVNIGNTHNHNNDVIITYLNRLSDYLFVLARYKAKLLGVEEVIWESKKEG